MPENELNKKLDELYKGVSLDIYNVEESLFLDRTIQEYAEEINKNKFGHLLGRMQEVRLQYARLYFCKIFEEPKKDIPLGVKKGSSLFLTTLCSELFVFPFPV